MSLFDDIFYDLASDLVDTFVEVETKFYVTRKSNRPFARPEEITSYEIPLEFKFKCSPLYKLSNKEDTGGVSRNDITSQRKDEMRTFVPEKNIPSGMSFDLSQVVSVEIDYEGRRIKLIDQEIIKADGKIGRILRFAS